MDIKIVNTQSLLDALKKMDEVHLKLLLVVNKKGEYVNLISIGDIQRAIIAGVDISSPVSKIEIDKKVVASPSDSLNSIKKVMQRIRCEFMPVIDDYGKLVKIYFWEDVFKEAKRLNNEPLDILVIIMAGGKGKRLKPISNLIPKPLIPIGDKTIVENIMDRFIEAGCNSFYFSVNYGKEMIRHYFETHGNYDISFFAENKPLGTAGSLSLIKNRIHSTFFVSNCDILIDQDLNELYKYHITNKNDITLVVALKHFNIPYGTVESGKSGLLLSMTEKPELTFKINAGLYVLEPHVLDEIPENEFYHITDLINKVKDSGGRVGVFPISEKSWVDIGEWPEYIKTVRSITSDNECFKGVL